MSPRKRNRENKSLPTGWRFRAGKYRYRVPPGCEMHWDNKKEFTLGKTLAEAHQAYAERLGYEGTVATMDQLCDRYTLEVVPHKKPATKKSNQYSLKRIRKAFAGNRVTAIQPVDLYTYQAHTIKTESPKKAALDHEVLSHMFTMAIRWGVISVHPMTDKKVVKPSTGKGRKVVPLEDQVVALANTMPEKWQLFFALLIWSGRRKGELLRVKKADLLEEGIRFVDNKDEDNVFILAWEPETRAIVKRILMLPGATRSLHLFANRSGQCYMNDDGECSGFDTMYSRYRAAALRDGTIHQRFTVHDMRKVRASQLSAEQAQNLLQHTNAKMTERYRPGAKLVDISSQK